MTTTNSNSDVNSNIYFDYIKFTITVYLLIAVPLYVYIVTNNNDYIIYYCLIILSILSSCTIILIITFVIKHKQLIETIKNNSSQQKHLATV